MSVFSAERMARLPLFPRPRLNLAAGTANKSTRGGATKKMTTPDTYSQTMIAHMYADITPYMYISATPVNDASVPD